jgi:hypothetical protein
MPPVIVTGEIRWRGLAAKIAINALIVHVILAARVLRILV